MRRNLTSQILYVSSSKPNADYRSISEATHNASEGDQIIVDEGVYSSRTTREKYPIYLPPRCQLIGKGAEKCRIDGGGTREIFDRPLDPNQSLILLGDETTLTDFTVCKSGANGVSNEQGARYLMTNNVIEGNGQHGLLVFATNGALVHNNRFIYNGAKKKDITVPRSATPAKQGHHVYIESRTGCTNDVAITGNLMQNVYADAIANDIFDQPDGVSMRIQVVGNTIKSCGRNGLSIAGSYGPSHASVFVDVRDNKILDIKGNAIDLLAAYSLIIRNISGANLFMNIVGNIIDGCDCGINAICAYDPESEGSETSCNIIQNDISNTKRYGIRAVGGLSYDDWSVENTRFNLTIADNVFGKTGRKSIFVQGGIAVNKAIVRNNRVFVHLFENKANDSRAILDPRAIAINDGLPSNSVVVIQGSQSHARKKEIQKYDVP